jgi:Clp amino terminal domain, pathogenicity island component
VWRRPGVSPPDSYGRATARGVCGHGPLDDLVEGGEARASPSVFYLTCPSWDARSPVFSDTLLGRLTMAGRLACAAALEAVVELGHNYVGCEHLLIGLVASEGQARDLLFEHGVQATALRQSIGAAAAAVVLERSRSADRDADAVADLTRRLEAIERQLAG